MINNKTIIRQPQKKAVGLLFKIRQATEIVDALTTLTGALKRLFVALAILSAIVYVIIF